MTAPTTTRRTGLLLALVTAGISGVAVFLNSYGVKAFGSASTYTTAKNLVSGVVLLALVSALAARAQRPVLTRPTRPVQWWGLAAIGVFGGAIAFLLFFEGLARASSVHAAFIHKTLLIWVALLAIPVLKERLSAAHFVAVGVLVVGSVGLAGGTSSAFGRGEAMIFGATLIWAAEVVLAKALLSGLSPWTIGLTRMGLGSAVLVAWLFVHGNPSALAHMTSRQWGWVLLTGVILAGYVGTWFAALSRAPAVDVTAVLVVAAVITTVLQAMVNGTPLVPDLKWLGLLVLGGALVLLPTPRRAALASSA